MNINVTLWLLICRVKNDEIRCPIDSIDKKDGDIITKIISDFKIIGSIIFYSETADPEGNQIF